MGILKSLLKGLVVVAIVLVAVGFFLPSTVHVERSTTIDAPRSIVFRVLNDLRRFNDWSPWADIAPDETEYSFSGPDTGQGATMSWESDHPDVGAGAQTIVASQPHEYVEILLDFGDAGQATSSFRLLSVPDGTRLTWAFDTDFGYNLFERYLGLFFDDWVGEDQERGLENLKALVESLPASRAPSIDMGIVDVDAQPLVWISGETGTDTGSVIEALDEAIARLETYIQVNELERDGPARAITHIWDEEAGRWAHDIALPVTELPDPLPDDGEVSAGMSYSGPALRAIHVGPPEEGGAVYDLIMAYIERNELEVDGPSWEIYVSEGDDGEPTETHIYFPIE